MNASQFLHPDIALVISDLCADRADAGTIYVAKFGLEHGCDCDLFRCVANATPESVKDLWPAVGPLIVEAINAALLAGLLTAPTLANAEQGPSTDE